MWASGFRRGPRASLPSMLHIVRGLALLLLMALGQAEPALALACEQPTHCAEQNRAPHDDAPGHGEPHEGTSCAAMLACGTAVALPSLSAAVLPAVRAAAPLSFVSLQPPSRADSPGNPPPRT